jgi:hypothetical protein
MKNIFFTTIASLFFLSSCSSDIAVSPAINIENCSVNGAQVSGVPSVKVGDEVELSLNLAGNGSELGSFQAIVDEKEIKMSLADYEKENVTTDKNFTNTAECQLRFVDGVKVSNVKVKAMVQSVDADHINMKFYLSAKANCEGSELNVELKKDESVK